VGETLFEKIFGIASFVNKFLFEGFDLPVEEIGVLMEKSN